MDWTTLISVVVGGLIATIPVLISNRFQSKERDKDRLEQRREARTQLALELMRTDIKVVGEEIDNSIRAIDFIYNLSIKRDLEKITQDEMMDEIIASALWDDTSKLYKFIEASTIATKVSNSLGAEFSSGLSDWGSLKNSFFDLITSSSSYSREERDKLYEKILDTAGELHAMLRNKLISIRDT